ncbi:hypothetical protein D3C73_916870 [compost metagenome]
MAGKSRHRISGIFNYQLGHSHIKHMLNHQCDRSKLYGLLSKFMSVYNHAWNTDEQISGMNLAGIRLNACKLYIGISMYTTDD